MRFTSSKSAVFAQCKTMAFMVAVLVLPAMANVASAAPSAKVKICHVPTGNPENFHTITVSQNALPSHLGHGDVPGSCFANAEALCDDGDACTIDSMDEQTEICLPEHPSVDCDDSLLCTSDSCDPSTGCQSVPIVCDDGDSCTVDACNPFDGQCSGTLIDCGPLGICLSHTGQCDFPCDGIICDPIDQCHEAGECVVADLCLDGIAKQDGTACNDGDASTINDQCTTGVCAGTEATTCLPGSELNPDGGCSLCPEDTGSDDGLMCMSCSTTEGEVGCGFEACDNTPCCCEEG